MKIFFSFAYDEDIHQVNGFRGMIVNPNTNINFTDGSCKKDYANKSENEIKRYISSLLDQSTVTVCLISKDTHKSKWVDWELQAAESKGKGIVGIVLNGQRVNSGEYPKFFQEKRRYQVIEWGDSNSMQRGIDNAG